MFSGYSSTTPTLWAMMGYDGMVIRFEGPDAMREQWTEEKAFEFLWEGSKVLPSNRSRIMTHAIRWNYGDMLVQGDGLRNPTQSFQFAAPVTGGMNASLYAHALVDWSRRRSSAYQGMQFLAVWGSDFQFQNATCWFDEMDKVLDEINSHAKDGTSGRYGGAVARYTTLSNYFDHLHQETNLSFPVKRGVSFEDG
jgi:hypothetical protein